MIQCRLISKFIIPLLLMINKVIQCLSTIKTTFKEAFQTQNFYAQNEAEEYSSEETIGALRFVLGSHATDYRLLMEAQHPLRVVSRYLLGQKKLDEAEQLLTYEQEALFSTSKYVLFMYKNYLEQVVPANIAFYHFIREKKYYAHLVIVRYIIIVGLAHKEHNVFHKLKNSYRLEFFRLLSDWLYNLIHYRCSAIYLNSSCVSPLITQTYILLSAMLGFDGHSQILTNMVEEELNQTYNKLLYINGFILSMAVPSKDYLTINLVLVVLRKLISSVPHQKVTCFMPSYLFAREIGYLPTPYTHEVIFKLLLNFCLSIYQEKEVGSGQALVQKDDNAKVLIIDIWSIIALMIQEYPGLDKDRIKAFVTLTFPKVEQKSMIRAFLLRAAYNEHLDIEDQKIGQYISKHKQPYLFRGKVIPIQTFTKNYHIVMNEEYIRTLREAAKGRMLKLDEHLIWQSILGYNKFEIISEDEYLQRKSLSPVARR